MSPSFMGMNLNKKSLTLNLKKPDALNIISKLMPNTDVVVENFKSGTMGRMGLDYESLKIMKPDLIYCSVTGYGQTGVKATDAAYDGAIQASSGMMSQNGHPETKSFLQWLFNRACKKLCRSPQHNSSKNLSGTCKYKQTRWPPKDH